MYIEIYAQYNAYLCGYKCASSCQTFGENVFRNIDKDRVWCPSG